KDSDGLYLAKDGAQLIDVKKLSLVGLHNYTNVLVVFALLESLGIAYQELLCDPHSDFSNALCQYQGLSHRCQLVVASHGVRWINDSKATNVASTQAALAGLDVEGCLHLLVGGDGKGADFSALKPLLSHYDLQLHCFGQDGETLAQLDPKARTWQTMDQAMAYIAAQVRAGDVVLLSPACASLDQYKNFMARGDAFIALAKHYAH
ncbi:MAG: glutamate ligase domain-containing protein, partial [Vibrio sp.]